MTTGFRPDLGFLSEVRLDLDPALQAPTRLAPLIDPNVHSCGTVYPHGAAELAQPEAGALRGRHEVLRPGADLPGPHRLRAGPLRRGGARRRPRERREGRAGPARDRRLRRCRPLRRGGVRRLRWVLRPRRTARCSPSGPAAADDPSARPVGGARRPRRRRAPPRRRRPLHHRDHLLGRPLLRLPGALRRDHRRHRLVVRAHHGRLLGRAGRHRAGRRARRPPARPARAASGDDRRGRCWPSPRSLLDRARPDPARLPRRLGAGRRAAMSAVLYTPAFTAVTRWGGARALRGLTAVTLVAGLASTVFAPLTAVLEHALGWRRRLPRAGGRPRRRHRPAARASGCPRPGSPTTTRAAGGRAARARRGPSSSSPCVLAARGLRDVRRAGQPGQPPASTGAST